MAADQKVPEWSVFQDCGRGDSISPLPSSLQNTLSGQAGEGGEAPELTLRVLQEVPLHTLLQSLQHPWALHGEALL